MKFKKYVSVSLAIFLISNNINFANALETINSLDSVGNVIAEENTSIDESELNEVADSKTLQYDVAKSNFESTIKEIQDKTSNGEIEKNQNIELYLTEDVSAKFEGIKDQNVILKSKENTSDKKYSITLVSPQDNNIVNLNGAVIFDNVKILTSYSNAIYSNCHRFETTERCEGTIASLYGGGVSLRDEDVKTLNGDTDLILRGSIGITNLYGAGYDSNITGNVNILIDDENIEIRNMYGGGHAYHKKGAGKVGKDVNIHLKKGKLVLSFGGGYNERYLDIDSSDRESASVGGNVNFKTGEIGLEGKVAYITDGSAEGIYGGSLYSTIYGNVNFEILDGSCFTENSYEDYRIIGSGACDIIKGNIKMYISKDSKISYAQILAAGNQPPGSYQPAMGIPVEVLNEKNDENAIEIICENENVNISMYADGSNLLNANIHGNVFFNVKNGKFNYISGNDFGTMGNFRADIYNTQVYEDLYGRYSEDGSNKNTSELNIIGGENYVYKIGYFNAVNTNNNSQTFGYKSKNPTLVTVKDLNMTDNSKFVTNTNYVNLLGNINMEENSELIFKAGAEAKGNVYAKNSSITFMQPSKIGGDWVAENTTLKLPKVSENYDGKTEKNKIPLNIDGLASGSTNVYAISPNNYETLMATELGENYITGFKEKNNPLENTFVLANEEDTKKGYYLKRVEDPGKDTHFMWQVAEEELLTLDYRFVSDNNKTKLPEVVLEEVEQFKKEKNHHDGDIIDIDELNEEIKDKDIEVSNGTWYFEGWAYKENENSGYEYIEEHEIEMHKDMELVGVWHFTPSSTGGGGGGTIVTPPTDPDRIEGNDRIETSVETSKDLYPNGTNAVVLANAERYTDVLTADPFAIQEKASALLTYKYEIPEKTLKEIQRLGAKKIYISGGYEAVSKKVVDELAAKGYEIFRFDGVDRYDTARKIAIKIREKGNTNTAELASGEDFPDALCMTPLAVKDHAPILLTKKDSIPKYTKQALAEWDIENIKIGGLDEAVSKEVEKQLKAGFEIDKNNKKDSNVYDGAKAVKRIGGEDRYETSAKLAKESYPESKLGVYATGEDFPDALIAGNYAGTKEAPVLLVKGDSLPEPIEKYTKESKIKKATIIGGVNAVSDKVFNLIKVIINNK